MKPLSADDDPFHLFHTSVIKKAFYNHLAPEVGADKARELWVKLVDDMHLIRQAKKERN
jgi:hypothetical protein